MFLNKRQKFVITSIILSLSFVSLNLLPDQFRLLAIAGLTLLTLILFVWSLWEGLGLNATLLTLVLPGFFTLGVGLFWFLLPTIILARIPVVLFYGIGIYALSLTANIYTVSAVRTIALMRAAKGVGFVLTLVTFFLLFDAIFSLRAPVWVNTPIIILSSFPLFLQGLWISKLGEFNRGLFLNSAIFSLSVGEIAAMLFFWPVTVVVGSLFLTVAAYALLGLGQAQEEGRLFKQTVREYLIVAMVVFVAVFLATRWGN